MRKPALVQRRRPGDHLLLEAACVIALAAGLGACGTVDNPSACSDIYPDCPTGTTCNMANKLCVPSVDVGVTDARLDRVDTPAVETGGDGGPGADGVDVPAPTDAGTDVGTDIGNDVPGSCAVDDHCTTEGLERCFEGRCVACLENDDCGEDRPWCSPTKTCETCLVAMTAAVSVCAAPRPHCDTGSGRCSECRSSADCADATRPICGPMKTCVSCTGNGGDSACAAKGPDLPRCSATGSGKCVACTESLHCNKADASPICVAEQCVPCTTDPQCVARNGANPGLCLVRAGRCARTDEVVYVKNAAGCSILPTSGTVDMPACSPAAGLLHTTATRNVLLLRGGANPLDRLSITSGTGALTVVGQQAPIINPGAGRGIELTVARDVYIQGLTVLGGDAEGVVVEGAGTLRLNRSIIKNNAKGGLVARGGAGYEISNSVFDGNGPGVTTQAFGGVSLEPATGGRQAIFRNNTVVNNLGPGVVCDLPSQVLYGILTFDNSVFDKVICSTPPGSVEGMPPLFAAGTYKLTAQSPCRDMGSMTNFPVDDFDGDKRPAGARSDCGADEYIGP